VAENRNTKGMRARKWATDENRGEIISPERTNMWMHYDFKPDENMYPSCENISIYFPLDFIKNFYVRNELSFPCPLPFHLLPNIKELSVQHIIYPQPSKKMTLKLERFYKISAHFDFLFFASFLDTLSAFSENFPLKLSLWY